MESKFSQKELKIIQLLCEGFNNSRVAAALRMEPPKVEEHLSTIFYKTNTSTWAELVVFALRNRLVVLQHEIAI